MHFSYSCASVNKISTDILYRVTVCDNSVCFCFCQKSFYRRLTNEKQSDTFFKVFYKRIQDAQQSIKVSMSASAEESLAGTENVDSKDDSKHERSKRKGQSSQTF